MNIQRPIDIEAEVRRALDGYLTAYVRPLPGNYKTPCILVTETGGTSVNRVDTFNVTLDSRAATDEEAYELIRNAQGVLEEQCRAQFGALRNVTVNSLARWGNDPVRPDLKLCTLTVLITAHRESFTIIEKETNT